MPNQVFSVKPSEDIEAAETPIGILSMNDIAREAAQIGSKLEEGISRVLRRSQRSASHARAGKKSGRKERAKERAKKSGQKTA